MKYLWFEKGAYVNKNAKIFISNDFNPENIKNIAVIRHAALGDQVITRPFLIEARRFFPNAHITLCIVSNYQYAIPEDLVDSVHVMHGSDRKKEITFSEKIRNIKELPEQDIVFDLASTSRSYWMTFFTKAKLKIGFPYRFFPFNFLYDAMVLRSDFVAEVDTQLHMLKLLGCNPSYPLDFAYPNNLNNKVVEKPFIVYFNGASQESKMYPMKLQKELLLKTIEEIPSYKHIFLEGLGSNEKGSELYALEKDNDNFVIQPALSLDSLIQLLSKATLVVSTDTGVRNLAIATHTPTVGIFYSTVPFRYTPQYEYHHIVMNACGELPSAKQVVEGIKKALQLV